MLKEIHDHMVHELHQNARTDTVFVVAADNAVDKYYSPDLLSAGLVRYTLFTLVLAVLAVIAIVVPLIERIVG